jgi:hypothetical protein
MAYKHRVNKGINEFDIIYQLCNTAVEHKDKDTPVSIYYLRYFPDLKKNF